MKRFSSRVFQFLTISIAVFMILVLLWPLAGESYGAFFRGAGNALTRGGRSRDVWFTKLGASSESHDVRLRLVNRDARLQQSIEISSRRHGYLPTAFVVALILATPIAWRLRLCALTWSLLLVNGYVASKLVLFPAAYAVNASDVEPGSLQNLLQRIFWVLSATSAGWMIVPLVIWLLMAQRDGFVRFNDGLDNR